MTKQLITMVVADIEDDDDHERYLVDVLGRYFRCERAAQFIWF